MPNYDREQAETLLRSDNRDGAFIVRLSTTEADCYTISVLVKE